MYGISVCRKSRSSYARSEDSRYIESKFLGMPRSIPPEYGEKESSRVKNTKKEYSSLYCGAYTKFANSAIRMMQYTMHTKTEKTKSSQRLFQPQT